MQINICEYARGRPYVDFFQETDLRMGVQGGKRRIDSDISFHGCTKYTVQVRLYFVSAWEPAEYRDNVLQEVGPSAATLTFALMVYCTLVRCTRGTATLGRQSVLWHFSYQTVEFAAIHLTLLTSYACTKLHTQSAVFSALSSAVLH